VDQLPILLPLVEIMMVLKLILQDEVVSMEKPTVEFLEFALMKLNVPRMVIAQPLVVVTIVKLLVDVFLALSHMKVPLALAMMVVKFLVKSTVILPADSVLLDVTVKMTALEHKEPTAWPTMFALIAEITLIVLLAMPGVEIELADYSV